MTEASHQIFQPIFGRDAVIEELETQLASRRLVTLVGSGGIGKTTVAHALAKRISHVWPDGIVGVELAALYDPNLLASTLAAALDLPVSSMIDVKSVKAKVLAYLQEKRILLVLDSCESQIEAVAELVESLLGATQYMQVLATSREPLLTSDEWVHRLAPIGLPKDLKGISPDEALSFPAIAMFAKCAGSRGVAFELTEHNVASVVDLCMRLDGIPLAIELAAAAMSEVGVEQLTSQLGEHVLALEDDNQTTHARHRTLGAMFDWSYERLDASEKRAFRRLSVFRGTFSIESAVAVVAHQASTKAAATNIVFRLIEKSLVSNANTKGDGRFRLLDTTRAYASQQLESDAERSIAKRIHAEHIRNILSRVERDWEQMPIAQWRAEYVSWLDDVRAALHWAYSEGGDPELGIKLTVDFFPLADKTSLMTDLDIQIDTALKVLSTLLHPLPWYEMRLKTAIGLVYQRKQIEQPEMETQLESAFNVARTTGSVKHQIGPLLALWSTAFQHGNYPRALTWSNRMGKVASEYADTFAQLTSERTEAQSLHFLGQHNDALRLAQHVREKGWQRIPLGYTPSAVDLRVSMGILIARIHWMQGLATQASTEASACLEAAAKDSPTALVQALGLAAIPIAIWRGDTALASTLVAQLKAHAAEFGFEYWMAWGTRYEATLKTHVGRHNEPRAGMASSYGANANKLSDHICSIDPIFWSSTSMDRVRSGAVGWCASEVIRGFGERMLLNGGATISSVASAAEACFTEAIAIAQRQQALAWELRATMSKARLLAIGNRVEMAATILGTVTARFTEGQDTADLIAARALLQGL
ncbi:ATP-binding protein [Variovorax sp. HJSM1_2]|uniref:ATP-binding protein n=1 Tax=Variovorax sp. HJSM1_2 TaxID=3366263 RepID=UPI003BE125C9